MTQIISPDGVLQATGDPDQDTANLTGAIARFAANRQPITPIGDFVLRPPANSPWNYRNQVANPMYPCVPIISGFEMNAERATFRMAPPLVPYAASAPRPAFFGTADLGIRQGTVKDVKIHGGTFDFANDYGALYPFTYAFAVTGTDDFLCEGAEFIASSGFVPASNRGFMFQNCRRRRLIDITFRAMCQGVFSHYDYGVQHRGLTFETFGEGIDFDGPAWDVLQEDLSFSNGQQEGQCIDTAGGARWVTRGVTAKNTGNVFMTYIKKFCPHTYEEFCSDPNDIGTSNPVRMEDNLWEGIYAENAGDPDRDECIRIGQYRDSTWPDQLNGFKTQCRRITLRDIVIKGGNHMVVHECEDLAIDNLELVDIQCTDISQDRACALLLRQSLATPQATLDSILTGYATNVRIRRSQGGGVFLSAPSQPFRLDVHVDGYNTGDTQFGKYGVAVVRLANKGGEFTLGDIVVQNGRAPGDGSMLTALQIGGSDDLAVPYVLNAGHISLLDDERFTVLVVMNSGEGGSNPCRNLAKKIEIPIESFAASSGSGMDFPFMVCTNGLRGYWGYAALVPTTAIAGDAVNNSFGRAQTINGATRTSIIPGTIDDVAHAAGAVIELNGGNLPDAADALLHDGDVALFNIGKNAGTGSTVPSMRGIAGVLEFFAK